MKKSISIWSFATGSLADKMRLAAEAGFKGIEIDLTEEGPVALDPARCDLAGVRKAADSAGIELSGLATVLYWGVNAASADEKVREEAGEILRRQIARVHFKDYRRAVGTIDGFCDLLSGDVDWAAVMAALRDTGYAGWAAAEMIPPVPMYKHCPEVLIHNTSRAMDAIFQL